MSCSTLGLMALDSRPLHHTHLPVHPTSGETEAGCRLSPVVPPSPTPQPRATSGRVCVWKAPGDHFSQLSSLT